VFFRPDQDHCSLRIVKVSSIALLNTSKRGIVDKLVLPSLPGHRFLKEERIKIPLLLKRFPLFFVSCVLSFPLAVDFAATLRLQHHITIELAPGRPRSTSSMSSRFSGKSPQEFGHSVLPQALNFALSIPSTALLNTRKRGVADKLVLSFLSGHRFLDFYLSLTDVLRMGAEPHGPLEDVAATMTALATAVFTPRPRPRPGPGSYNLE
jgi:hypothetical protein